MTRVKMFLHTATGVYISVYDSKKCHYKCRCYFSMQKKKPYSTFRYR
uniref:Uncharacterized protein n=1 Tax=Anguilla anguilla TaxID=7936 RepID=A0A0E9SXM9_ANGAN